MSRQKMDTFEYIGNFLVFFEKEHPRKKSERKTYFIKRTSVLHSALSNIIEKFVEQLLQQ